MNTVITLGVFLLFLHGATKGKSYSNGAAFRICLKEGQETKQPFT